MVIAAPVRDSMSLLCALVHGDSSTRSRLNVLNLCTTRSLNPAHVPLRDLYFIEATRFQAGSRSVFHDNPVTLLNTHYLSFDKRFTLLYCFRGACDLGHAVSSLTCTLI